MTIARTIGRRFFEDMKRRKQVRRVTPIAGAGVGKMIVRVDGCNVDRVADSIGSPECGQGALLIKDGFQAAVVASPVAPGPRSSIGVTVLGAPFEAPKPGLVVQWQNDGDFAYSYTKHDLDTGAIITDPFAPPRTGIFSGRAIPGTLLRAFDDTGANTLTVTDIASGADTVYTPAAGRIVTGALFINGALHWLEFETAAANNTNLYLMRSDVAFATVVEVGSKDVISASAQAWGPFWSGLHFTSTLVGVWIKHLPSPEFYRVSIGLSGGGGSQRATPQSFAQDHHRAGVPMPGSTLSITSQGTDFPSATPDIVNKRLSSWSGDVNTNSTTAITSTWNEAPVFVGDIAQDTLGRGVWTLSGTAGQTATLRLYSSGGTILHKLIMPRPPLPGGASLIFPVGVNITGDIVP